MTLSYHACWYPRALGQEGFRCRGRISRVHLSAWVSSRSKMPSPCSQQVAESQRKLNCCGCWEANMQSFRRDFYYLSLSGTGGRMIGKNPGNFAGPVLLLTVKTARRKGVIFSGGGMNCISYDICVYHFWLCLCFFPGVFNKNFIGTSAVSSTNFESKLIFASCVVGTCNIPCG